MNELALFAGAGGGILGGKLLGWRTVCAVERDAYAAQVLAQRQNDGILEPFPIWSDVCSFDGKPWRGIVDVVSGGFPCQDISEAGKGAGIEGERSGLWSEFARIIGEVRPKYAFVENSPMLPIRGLGTILRDLARMGFDAEWGMLSAVEIGAPHIRCRTWILARQRDILSHTEHHGNGRGKQFKTGFKETHSEERKFSNAFCNRLQGSTFINSNECQAGKEKKRGQASRALSENIGNRSWWNTEPKLGRVANGVANRVDRLKAIGNGQVPLCAATAFELLRARFE